ncbi:MAG TPA: hypothetical protein PKE45_03810 [Caldilineaceae bacterium]|nr:hypothetical protein [Caldilineaceae bacterium]
MLKLCFAIQLADAADQVNAAPLPSKALVFASARMRPALQGRSACTTNNSTACPVMRP